MLTRPGAPSRPGALQPLDEPRPVEVRLGDNGAPVAVRLAPPVRPLGSRRPARGRWQAIASVDDIWLVETEWWRGPEHEVSRTYCALTLEGGRRATVFHDAIRDRWFQQAG